MNLDEYLFRKKISVKDFSMMLNCSRTYISRIVNGMKPGKYLAKEIERITNGEVTAEELLKGEKR